MSETPRKVQLTDRQAERLQAVARQIDSLRDQYHAMLSVLWPYDGPAQVTLMDGDEGPELVETVPQVETKEP